MMAELGKEGWNKGEERGKDKERVGRGQVDSWMESCLVMPAADMREV